MHSRRSAILRIVTATASAVTPARPASPAHDPEHHMGEIAADNALPHPHAPSFLNKTDYETMCRVADLIIPRTDTPGALDADVPYRIDRQAGATPKLQAIFQQGLSQLSASKFLESPEAQQNATLKQMSESPDTPGGQFFLAMKELTIEWYYRSEQGLVQELGFKGNTFRANFPGCTHPEHWPKQENA